MLKVAARPADTYDMTSCDECTEPTFIEYANGARRCAGHTVPFAWLSAFEALTVPAG